MPSGGTIGKLGTTKKLLDFYPVTDASLTSRETTGEQERHGLSKMATRATLPGRHSRRLGPNSPKGSVFVRAREGRLGRSPWKHQ